MLPFDHRAATRPCRVGVATPQDRLVEGGDQTQPGVQAKLTGIGQRSVAVLGAAVGGMVNEMGPALAVAFGDAGDVALSGAEASFATAARELGYRSRFLPVASFCRRTSLQWRPHLRLARNPAFPWRAR